MALRGVDYIGDDDLDLALEQIVAYLSNRQPRRFSVFRRARMNQINGWSNIVDALELFLEQPQQHYAPLIRKIELEKAKFSSQVGYVKALEKLELVLKRGPTITRDKHHCRKICRKIA